MSWRYGLCYVFLLILLGDVQAQTSCFLSSVASCEQAKRDRVIGALNGDDVDAEAMCSSFRTAIACASQINCNGARWDSTEDYFTYMLQFLEDTGMCGGNLQTTECGQKVSRVCLVNLAVEMKKAAKPCEYYGDYAACIIAGSDTCDDETVQIIAMLMSDQLADNRPTAIGSDVMSVCPNWSEDFAKYISRK